LSEDLQPSRNQPFEIGDLVRLNEELKQLRETLRRKKAEREKAKQEGRKLLVDLTPEIERLSRFLVDLDRVTSRFRSPTTSGTKGKPIENDALRNVLAQVKVEIENEKKKLEEERAAREQERLKHEEELQRLKDELLKNKELLDKDRKSLESLLSKRLEQSQKLQPTPEEGKGEIRREAEDLRPEPRSMNELEGRRLDSLELRLRDQISREQEALEIKRRELDDEKRRIDEEKRTLETKVADEFSAIRSELQKLREQITREQEALETKRRELHEEKRRVDEEKRTLEERIGDVEDDRLRYMTRRTMEELQAERMELSSLKRSLQQLRAESTRERKGLEKDREAILRARVTLENEKRKVALRNMLLQIRAKSAVVLERPTSRSEKPRKDQVTEAEEKKAIEEKTSGSTSGASEGAVVLGVRLGDEDYGIDISRVREIMTKRAITPMPRQPTYVEGVMNVRGTIIPVVNLRKRFGLKGEFPENPHTVIVDSTHGMVGILVDSVSEVIRLPQDRIHAPPAITSGMEGEYLRGICRVGDQLLLYLDVEKILRKATPVATLYTGSQLRIPTHTGLSLLSRDEQRLLNAIPANGGVKTRVMRRVRFGNSKFDKLIASLSRKGLIKVSKDGNRRIIRRTLPHAS